MAFNNINHHCTNYKAVVIQSAVFDFQAKRNTNKYIPSTKEKEQPAIQGIIKSNKWEMTITKSKYDNQILHSSLEETKHFVHQAPYIKKDKMINGR